MRLRFTQRARKRGRFAAAALTFALGLTATAYAQTPAPNADEARLDAVFQKFDGKRDSVEGTLRSLELKLIKVEQKLIKLRAAQAKAESVLAQKQTELNVATQELADQRGLVSESAAGMYMRGPWSYLNAILNAEDLGSVVRAEVYSESVLNDFVRILHQRQQAVISAQEAHTAALAKAQEARRRTAEVQKEQAEIVDGQQLTFRKRQALINDLIADFGGLDELRKRGFDIILRSYSGSSTRIKTALQNAQQGQDVAQDGEYLLRWPVEEHRITSPFGWRIHPLWGYRSMHTGIDIGSDYNDKITTSLAGRVADVGYMGAYGLAIVIDHGHSLATVYSHMSRVAVNIGQELAAGQEIGRVGCSGWCTGPHVHYEVRVATEPVNPVLWF
jgi:murein DD-endopeptidase MepM/ murein hydrolase activator NlpD